jgi:hypothetical protein
MFMMLDVLDDQLTVMPDLHVKYTIDFLPQSNMYANYQLTVWSISKVASSINVKIHFSASCITHRLEVSSFQLW